MTLCIDLRSADQEKREKGRHRSISPHRSVERTEGRGVALRHGP